MATEFNTQMAYERSQMKSADQFYTRHGAVKVTRANYNNSQGEKELQRGDIDCILTMDNGKEYTVSEKFRTKDYGDCLLELSTFSNRDGWSIISKAQVLCIFTPTNIYMCNMKGIVNAAKTIKGLGAKAKDVFPSIQYKDHKSYNSNSGSTWNEKFCTVSWEDLKKSGVKVRVFSR